jgi:hypothetical protein
VGRQEEALSEYRNGLTINEKLAAADHGNGQSQINLAVSLFSFAETGDATRVYT